MEEYQLHVLQSIQSFLELINNSKRFLKFILLIFVSTSAFWMISIVISPKFYAHSVILAKGNINSIKEGLSILAFIVALFFISLKILKNSKKPNLTGYWEYTCYDKFSNIDVIGIFEIKHNNNKHIIIPQGFEWWNLSNSRTMKNMKSR